MSDEAARTLAHGFIIGCIFIMAGLIVSKPSGISYHTAKVLGAEIASGIEGAACINMGGEWRDYANHCAKENADE